MTLLNCGRTLARIGLMTRSSNVALSEIWSRQLCRSRSNLRSGTIDLYGFMYSHHCNNDLLPPNVSTNSISILRYSSSSNKPSEEVNNSKDEEKDLTVFQRFTKVYKEYGKTLIAVHIATSIVWYGGFYILARSGIDLLPLLVKLGASEAIQTKYLAAGDFLVAYLIYEIAKPVRYLTTLAATRQTVIYLRKAGYLPPLKPEDKLRNLAKDGRDNLKDKYQDKKDDMKERYADKKAEYQERWHEVKQRSKNISRNSPRNYGVGSKQKGLPSHRTNGLSTRHNKKPPGTHPNGNGKPPGTYSNGNGKPPGTYPNGNGKPR